MGEKEESVLRTRLHIALKCLLSGISPFLRPDRFWFLCWTRARKIVNLTKENPRRKWGSERKKRKKDNDSSGYSWHIHIHGGHEETYTKWIMGQWRGPTRFTSLDREFLIFETGISREGLRLCARVARERRAAAVRAHCRLAVHYAKRLNDRNICIFAHWGSGEALRRALWRPESVVSSRRRLSVRAEQRLHVSKLLSRETLDSTISRASWHHVTLGSFECLRSVARLQ